MVGRFANDKEACKNAETFATFGDLVEFDNNNAAYLDLKAGRVDAFVVDVVVGRYMSGQD